MPLPNRLHVPWATRAMEAGNHVLCEKPLCTAIEGVNELIDVRDRTGRHIEEALSYRNHPQWQTVADLLTAGTIGDIKSVHATMANGSLTPRTSATTRTSAADRCMTWART